MKASTDLLICAYAVSIFGTLAILAGCARPPARIVPPSLLTCADQPVSPADDPAATQRDVALYIVDLAVAGEDCRRNLGSVRRILNPETK